MSGAGAGACACACACCCACWLSWPIAFQYSSPSRDSLGLRSDCLTRFRQTTGQPYLSPSRVGQGVAAGIATERSATTRLKDSYRLPRLLKCSSVARYAGSSWSSKRISGRGSYTFFVEGIFSCLFSEP